MGVEEWIPDSDPATKGVQYAGTAFSITTGVVIENWSEENKGMVLVEMSIGEEGRTNTEWIPVMQPYCGNGFGQYFLPEVGTQVVLGFQEGDVNSPIVMGCLWNEVDVLPEETAREDNSLKKIQTKGGNRIEIDESEGKEKIGIYTSGGISLQLQDEDQTISLRDSDGSTMIQVDIRNGELRLTADKKLILSVGGEDALVIDGTARRLTLSTGKLEAEGKQMIQLKSQNTKIAGNQTEVSGQGSLKVKSSGILELKGSIAKIN